MSIGIGVENVALDPPQGEQVMVGGRNATRAEVVSDTPGFEGTFYVYRIDLGGGQTVAARTSDQGVGPYQENKDILDAMMDSLVFGSVATPTPEPTATRVASQLPNAALPAPAAPAPSTVMVLLTSLIAFTGAVLLAIRRR